MSDLNQINKTIYTLSVEPYDFEGYYYSTALSKISEICPP